MPRPMIGTEAKQQTKLNLSTGPVTPVTTPAQLEKRLRQKRSLAYVQAMSKLDVGGHVYQQDAIEDLIQQIQQELPEVQLPDLPVGIVAKCYLGAPYEVHILDRDLRIAKHFKTSEPLPGLLERARSLALHPSYAFVEVYQKSLYAVRDSGDVSVVNIE